MPATLPDGWRTASFRFTLEPTAGQRELIARHLGASRFAWNQALRLVKDALDARDEDGTTAVPWTPFSIINAFNAWKRSSDAGSPDGLPWRSEVFQGVMEEACVDLGRALGAVSGSRNGTRKGARMGFPRFKKRGRSAESCRFRAKDRRSVQVGSDDAARVVKLPRIGAVRVREDTRRVRRLIRRGARPLQATVRRDGRRLVAAITLACPPLHQAHHHQGGGPAIGLDRGLTALVVGATADGAELVRVENPRHLARSLRQLRRASRVMSRRRRGSARRERARRRVARLHQRVRHQRADFTNKLTTDLAKTHGRICVETLGIRGLIRTRLARAISDAAWGEIERQLDYKLAWRSGALVRAPRWLPSTRACSACGEVGPALALSERTFACAGCGHSADRDTDAAALLAAWADGRITLDAELEDRRPEVPGDAKRSPAGIPGEGAAGVLARPGDRTRSPLAGTAEKAAVSELAAWPEFIHRPSVVPLPRRTSPRRFITRWNDEPFQHARRHRQRWLGSLYDSELGRVSPGDLLYVLHRDDHTQEIHLVCRFTVESVEPVFQPVAGSGDLLELQGWNATGDSDRMRYERSVDPVSLAKRLLAWRTTVYTADRREGFQRIDDVGPHYRGVPGWRFMRPLVIEAGDDRVPFLGQTIRRLTEIATGWHWLDERFGDPAGRAGGFALKRLMIRDRASGGGPVHWVEYEGWKAQGRTHAKHAHERQAGQSATGRGSGAGRSRTRREPGFTDEERRVVSAVPADGIRFAALRAALPSMDEGRLGDVLGRLRARGILTRSQSGVWRLAE